MSKATLHLVGSEFAPSTTSFAAATADNGEDTSLACSIINWQRGPDVTKAMFSPIAPQPIADSRVYLPGFEPVRAAHTNTMSLASDSPTWNIVLPLRTAADQTPPAVEQVRRLPIQLSTLPANIPSEESLPPAVAVSEAPSLAVGNLSASVSPDVQEEPSVKMAKAPILVQLSGADAKPLEQAHAQALLDQVDLEASIDTARPFSPTRMKAAIALAFAAVAGGGLLYAAFPGAKPESNAAALASRQQSEALRAKVAALQAQVTNLAQEKATLTKTAQQQAAALAKAQEMAVRETTPNPEKVAPTVVTITSKAPMKPQVQAPAAVAKAQQPAKSPLQPAAQPKPAGPAAPMPVPMAVLNTSAQANANFAELDRATKASATRVRVEDDEDAKQNGKFTLLSAQQAPSKPSDKSTIKLLDNK